MQRETFMPLHGPQPELQGKNMRFLAHFGRGDCIQKDLILDMILIFLQVGLGNCADLYQKGCINTEWFDLDDPVSDGVEEESVPYAHQLVISTDPRKMKTRFTQKVCIALITKYLASFHFPCS